MVQNGKRVLILNILSSYIEYIAFLQAYREKYNSYIGKIYTIEFSKYLHGKWFVYISNIEISIKN
jgi:hypothetical protein